ncbi:microtubule-associated protein 70-1 [Artemisia annua]|uniref:Microtubule-associated protein 70-1 n=1 Tax=Artemisia annua TaxID=35608 RepID=A0A2U1MAD1_ARTAN|nr:microtubule-associated protein 70-1 [Artemisia annua]
MGELEKMLEAEEAELNEIEKLKREREQIEKCMQLKEREQIEREAVKGNRERQLKETEVIERVTDKDNQTEDETVNEGNSSDASMVFTGSDTSSDQQIEDSSPRYDSDADATGLVMAVDGKNGNVYCILPSNTEYMAIRFGYQKCMTLIPTCGFSKLGTRSSNILTQWRLRNSECTLDGTTEFLFCLIEALFSQKKCGVKLQRMNRQKVSEVEKVAQTVCELEEAVLAGGADANAVHNYNRKLQEMNISISFLRDQGNDPEKNPVSYQITYQVPPSYVKQDYRDLFHYHGNQGKSGDPLSLDIPSNGDDESFPSNGGNNLAVGKRPKIETTLISPAKKTWEEKPTIVEKNKEEVIALELVKEEAKPTENGSVSNEVANSC